MAALGRLAWVFGARGVAAIAHDRVQALIALLPPGRLWRVEPATNLYKLLAAFADELERVRARYLRLLEERDPRTASETLSDWEASLSLPDDVVPVLPTTPAERRLVITQKYLATGGQSYAFFAALTAQCGYPLVSIGSGGSMLRAGFRCGSLADGNAARCYGAAWLYTCIITVGPAGSPALTHAQLESVLRNALHAHLSLLVVYT